MNNQSVDPSPMTPEQESYYVEHWKETEERMNAEYDRMVMEELFDWLKSFRESLNSVFK
jgi:hypothetical protein